MSTLNLLNIAVALFFGFGFWLRFQTAFFQAAEVRQHAESTSPTPTWKEANPNFFPQIEDKVWFATRQADIRLAQLYMLGAFLSTFIVISMIGEDELQRWALLLTLLTGFFASWAVKENDPHTNSPAA